MTAYCKKFGQNAVLCRRSVQPETVTPSRLRLAVTPRFPHSRGIRRPDEVHTFRSGLIAVALQQVLVGVDAPVAQERPDAAHPVAVRQVEGCGQDLFRLRRGLGQELPLAAGNEAAPPEADAAPVAVGAR